MKRGKLELSSLVEKFMVYEASEGFSEKTVEWYQQALGLFQTWLAEEDISACLDDIGKEEVRLLILCLKTTPGLRSPASSHTVNNRVRALRSFFNWLYEEDYTECHRLEKVKPPKPREKEIDILTNDEVEKIFSSINPNSTLGARNTAIFSLMLDTGLRLSEVVTLKYKDVHFGSRYVKVLGKETRSESSISAPTAKRHCSTTWNTTVLKIRSSEQKPAAWASTVSPWAPRPGGP